MTQSINIVKLKSLAVKVATSVLVLWLGACVGYEYPPQAARTQGELIRTDDSGSVAHVSTMSLEMYEETQRQLDRNPEADSQLIYGYDLAFPTVESMRDLEPTVEVLLGDRKNYITIVASDDGFLGIEAAEKIARRRAQYLMNELMTRGIYLSQMYYMIRLPRDIPMDRPRLDPYARIVRVYLQEIP